MKQVVALSVGWREIRALRVCSFDGDWASEKTPQVAFEPLHEDPVGFLQAGESTAGREVWEGILVSGELPQVCEMECGSKDTERKQANEGV